MCNPKNLTTFLNEPLWPGNHIVNGFEDVVKGISEYTWGYTCWDDKVWFCMFYSGNVDFDNLVGKGDVENVENYYCISFVLFNFDQCQGNKDHDKW